jgi:hypothetical protein
LPVSLLFFDGSIQDLKINLNWATASEKDFDYFTVERSADAENFTAIGTVKGAGHSSTLKKYGFTDPAPLKGKSYYRLKATDFDGSVEYHQTIKVEYEGFSPSSSFTIFPNPLESHTFTLSTNLKTDNQSIIRIFNMVGVEVFHKNIASGNAQFTFEKPLDTGVYLVVVQNATEKIQSRLMVR